VAVALPGDTQLPAMIEAGIVVLVCAAAPPIVATARAAPRTPAIARRERFRECFIDSSFHVEIVAGGRRGGSVRSP
jgi:hypothetical protein